MDIDKIKRRERRFYRKEEDGDIVYTEKPKEETVSNKSTTTVNLKDGKLTTEEKQKIIDKILLDMKSTINPDIDEISDMIYSQLSIRNTNITPESVKEVVQNNAHYRSSRRDRTAGTESTATSSKTEGITENYDFLNDRKELEVVIDDIVEENKKEDIRAKDRKDKEKIPVASSETTKESPRSRRAKEEAPKDKPKPKETSSEKPKPEKKKEFKLDFGDDEEASSDEKTGDEDELGLKF